MKKLLFAFLLVLVAGLLSACGGEEHDEALFGTWIWDGNVSYTYIFNEDGTGQRGDADIQEFSWSTSDDELTLDFGRGILNDSWTYTITDYALNLTRRGGAGESFDYFRVEHNPVFVGTWAWEHDDMFEYVFNADGTGSLSFGPEEETFRWFTAGSRIIMNVGPLIDEHWNFEIVGDVLTLDSRQVTGLTENFIRVS